MITLDTGALTALEHREPRMLRIVDAAAQIDARITVPTVVLAEWSRGRLFVNMRRLFEGVELEPLNPDLAFMAGEAQLFVKGVTAHAAIVVASAAQRGDTIFTSDVQAFSKLAHYFRRVRVLPV